MIFNIEFLERKGEGWIVASLTEAVENGASYTDVSINKTDKKTGAVAFPKFDELMPGHTIEGNIWKSPSDKYYLFAPKPKAEGGARSSSYGVKAAQERKAEGIKEAQENKAHAIMLASAFRDATLMLNTLPGDFETPEEMWESHKALRERYIKEWKQTEKSLDVPF